MLPSIKTKTGFEADPGVIIEGTRTLQQGDPGYWLATVENPPEETPVDFPEKPMFVIKSTAQPLLNRDNGAATVDSAFGGVDMADRGPEMSGGGANLQAKVPPRPIGGRPVTGLTEWLTAGQPRTSVIRRDPKIYEFDADTIDWKQPINMEDGVMATSHDSLQPIERENVERQLLQVALVPRNSVNPGWAADSGKYGAGRDEEVQVGEPGNGAPEKNKTAPIKFIMPVKASQKNDVNKAEPTLKKASSGGPHLYITKTYHHGHWVYEYAKKLGGGIDIAHSGFTDKAEISVDKAAGALLLAALKDNAIPFTGYDEHSGKVHLKVTHADMAKLHWTHAGPLLPGMSGYGKPTPHAIKPPEAPKATQDQPPAQTQPEPSKAAKSTHSDLQAVSSASLVPNPKMVQAIPHLPGQTVTVGGILPGKVLGWDVQGKAVVIGEDGARMVAEWDHVEAHGEKQKPFNPVNKLPEGRVFKPSAPQKKVLGEVLTGKLKTGKNPMDYANWMAARGHTTYLVGGLLRDMLLMTIPGEEKPHAEVLEAMNDVDFVSTCPPSLLANCHAAMGGTTQEPYPELLVKGCNPDPSNVDLNSVSCGGVFETPVILDNGVMATPSTFGHDLIIDADRRDFTCNTVYYDVHADVIVDPTGTGIDDSRKKILRRLPGAEWDKPLNSKAAVRFFKFRARGWGTDAQTLTDIKARCATDFTALIPGGKLIKEVGTQIFKNDESPTKCLEGFKAAMVADGLAHVYDQFIKPIESSIITKINHKKAEVKG